MKAMIFAAGLGSRLREITETIPKALVNLNGKSALHRAVEYCTSKGFDDIIINVHHFADMVENEVDLLTGQGYRITISDERDKLLENGGGLFKARKFFNDDPFLLYNVDIVTDLDLKAMYGFYKSVDCIATVAVRHRPGRRFLLIDTSGRMQGWCNNETGERIIPGKVMEGLSEIANSSVHIVNPEIFNYMHEGIYSMVALYLELAASHKIMTFKHDEGYWVDIGTPSNLEEARKFLS